MGPTEEFELRECVQGIFAMFIPAVRARNLQLELVWDVNLPALVTGPQSDLRLKLIQVLGERLDSTQGFLRLRVSARNHKASPLKIDFEVFTAQGLQTKFTFEVQVLKMLKPQASLVDLETEVLRRMANIECSGESLATVLVEDFLHNSEELILNLEEAHKQEDWNRVCNLAYALGALSLTVGLKRLRTICQGAEARPELLEIAELLSAWMVGCERLDKFVKSANSHVA